MKTENLVTKVTFWNHMAVWWGISREIIKGAGNAGVGISLASCPLTITPSNVTLVTQFSILNVIASFIKIPVKVCV